MTLEEYMASVAAKNAARRKLTEKEQKEILLATFGEAVPTPVERLEEAYELRRTAYSETFYLRFPKELPYYNALNDLADAWGQEDYTSYNLLIGSMLDLWTEQNRFF